MRFTNILLPSIAFSIYVPPNAKSLESGTPGLILPNFESDIELKSYLEEHHDLWFKSLYSQLSTRVLFNGYVEAPPINVETMVEKILSETYSSLSPIVSRLNSKLDQVYQQILPYISNMRKVENECFKHPITGDFSNNDVSELVSCILDDYLDPPAIFFASNAPHNPQVEKEIDEQIPERDEL